MRKGWSLRGRIFAILFVFILMILAGGVIMVWYTYQMETLVRQLVDIDVSSLQEVGNLERELANQKGFVSYYFIDENPEWLQKLEQHRRNFRETIRRVKELARTVDDKAKIDIIEARYNDYIQEKDQVIALYQAGEKERGAELHQGVRNQFFNLLLLCQQYMNLHQERIKYTQQESDARAQHLRIIAVTTMSAAVLLGCLLAVILVTQILGPVRRLAMETDRSGGGARPGDEVVALGQQVRNLIKDMEKFALVGQLAAGVAHSIRNPLTSVKMRLFSMERSLELSPPQKEDFEVIAEEIRHLDTIVRNFLEFSRPPKLKPQPVSPSDVVTNALQLLHHRLESFNVTVKVHRKRRLPEVSADPEQLKEVLVNLIVNACEAMPHGGTITIHEYEGGDRANHRTAVLELTDNGPGIPSSIQDKVFQPFFSTKEEGTGLGLSIAARIITEHGGQLDLKSREGRGTTFIINLPLYKENHEHDTSR